MAQISRREDLIAGAIACLETKGFARTTARDITAASGANLASIGYHFGSKEALLNEALIRIFEERNRYVATITFRDEDASPIERLTTTFTAVRGIFERFRPALVAFVEAIAEGERSPELRHKMAAHYRDARRGIGVMLHGGLGTAGSRLRRDPGVMASVLLATLDGLVIQFLLAPEDTPPGEDLVEALTEWMAVALELSAPVPKQQRRAAKPRARYPRGNKEGR